MIDAQKVGGQIRVLRKNKGITQTELGDRLGVSFQAVSKWERGETLPDTALLPALADVLETTIDNILLGGEKRMRYERHATVAQMKEGIECFARIGELLGKDSLFYIGALEGVDRKMNLETEKYLADPYSKEALIAEATVQAIQNGTYVDLTDIQKSFTHPHWVKVVTDFAKKYQK